jgi:diguanylate cyclase (GGDEF)-like protein
MAATTNDDPARSNGPRLDALTGLPGWHDLWKQVDEFLARAGSEASSWAVWFVDIDDMRRTNNEIGNTAGDELLKLLARRMSAFLSTSDVLARLGDQFILYRQYVDGRDEGLDIAEQLRAAIDQPFILPGRAGSPSGVHAHITASIGLALGKTDLPATDFLMQAEWAMHEAKSLGGNRAVLFDDLKEVTVSANRPRPAGLPSPSWERACEIDHLLPLHLGRPGCRATALGEAIEEQSSPLAGLRRVVHCRRVDGHPLPHVAGLRNWGEENAEVFAWNDPSQQQ